MPNRRTIHEWNTIAQKFRPYVKICDVWVNLEHFVDKYKPSSVDWFTQRCRLKDRNDSKVNILSPKGQDFLKHNKKSSYLEPTVDTSGGDINNAPYYVSIRSASGGNIDVDYWFFYPYNGAVGNGMSPSSAIFGYHEGDWEHIIVRLDEHAAKIVQINYVSHGDGQWLNHSTTGTPDNETYKLIGGRPLVYSAWHSHASYPSVGLHFRKETGFFANDRTGDGITWNGNAELMSIESSLLPHGTEFSQPGWLPWIGRWGSTEDHWYNLDQSLSPEGPGVWQPPGDTWSSWTTLHEFPSPYSVAGMATNLSIGGFLGAMMVVRDNTKKLYYASWTQQDPQKKWTKPGASSGVSSYPRTHNQLCRASNQMLVTFTLRGGGINYAEQTLQNGQSHWPVWKNLTAANSVVDFAAIQDIDLNIHVILINNHGTVEDIVQTGMSPLTWAKPVPTSVPSAKSVLVAKRLNARAAAVVETKDSRLFLGHLTNGRWSFDITLPGTYSPTHLVVNSDDRLQLFSLTGDGVIRYCYQKDSRDDTVWSDWVVLPGLHARKIEVAADDSGLLTVFGLTEANELWRAEQLSDSATAWNKWEKFDSKVDDMWVGANVGARLEIFATQGHKVIHRWQK